jgi:hypothetical protein
VPRIQVTRADGGPDRLTVTHRLQPECEPAPRSLPKQRESEYVDWTHELPGHTQLPNLKVSKRRGRGGVTVGPTRPASRPRRSTARSTPQLGPDVARLKEVGRRLRALSPSKMRGVFHAPSLTIEEAAVAAGCSEKKIRQAIASNALPETHEKRRDGSSQQVVNSALLAMWLQKIDGLATLTAARAEQETKPKV